MLVVLTANGKVYDYLVILALLSINGKKGHLHLGESCGNVGKEGDVILGEHLDCSLKESVGRCASSLCIPFSLNKTFCKLGILDSVCNILAGLFMNRYAVASCNKSDNIVTGQRITASCKLNGTAVLSVDNDTVIGADTPV